MMKHRSGLAFAFLLMALLLVTGHADAYTNPKDLPKLDMTVRMTKQEFLRASDMVEESPAGDEQLSYRIRVPKGWIKLPTAKTDEMQFTAEIFKSVVSYLSPPNLDRRSSFRIRALELKHFVSADNWFLNYILMSGSTVDGFNMRTSRRIEAQYTVLDMGQSYTVRAVAEISGSRIVLAEYLVPSETWEEERDLQIWTMMSFQLTKPELSPIEKVDTYAFVDIVKFMYPNSWILFAPAIISIDRMEASILNIKGITKDQAVTIDMRDTRLDGRIDIYVVSKNLGTTETMEIETLKGRFLKRGLIVGDLISSVDPVQLHEGVKQSKIDAYQIGSENSRLIGYETWIAVLETKGRYYMLSLITPGRNEDFYRWAQNTETFKYVMGSLAPVNDTSMADPLDFPPEGAKPQ